MKADRTKHSYRFSPLAPRRTNTPSLSRPRKASEDTLSSKSIAKLFASQANEFEAPLSGYGALCSQVSETQFFAQFGVDVSLPIANAYSPNTTSPVSSPTPSPSKQPPQTPPKINTSLIHDPFENYQYGSRLRGPLLGVPKYIDFSPEPYCWGDPLTNEPDMDLDSWPVDAQGNEITSWYGATAFGRIKIHPESNQIDPPSPAPSSGSSVQAIDINPSDDLTELSEFETWLVHQVRAAHAKGDSTLDGLKQLRSRLKDLEDENFELSTRLTQIMSVCAPV